MMRDERDKQTNKSSFTLITLVIIVGIMVL